MENLRWSKNVVCPHCDSKRTSRQKVYQYHQCKDCRKKFTVRTGTIFERSHIPLDKWLYGMYILQTARKGISSLQLSKELGITQKATWFMLHRLREACDVEAAPLFGEVEVDETYFGGLGKNMHESKKRGMKRGTGDKQAVIGMKERGGRVHAKHLPNTRTETIEREVFHGVESGSTLYTDEHAVYRQLGERYQH